MKKKKQKYSKIIPALALLGGAYLLLSKSSAPTPTGTSNNTPTGTGPFIPNSTTLSTTVFESSTSGSQVSGTEIIRAEGSVIPNYNTWKGKDWYLFVETLSKSMTKKNAIESAFKYWNNPENKKYSFMPNEASFLLGIAMAQKIPYYNKKDLIESGDFGIGEVPVDRPINWDSQPVYDTYYNWWYDVEAWSCQDWIDWHKALERKYNSTQRANDIWRSAWFSSQNSGANAALENNWYYCPRDCANFVRYFASKGITDTGGGFTAPVYCDLSGIIQNIVGTIESGTNAIQNTSNVLKIAIPVAVIGLGYFAYKKVLPALQKKYL